MFNDMNMSWQSGMNFKSELSQVLSSKSGLVLDCEKDTDYKGDVEWERV